MNKDKKEIDFLSTNSKICCGSTNSLVVRSPTTKLKKYRA